MLKSRTTSAVLCSRNPNSGGQLRAFRPSDLRAILLIERHSFGPDAWNAERFRNCHRKCPQLFRVAVRAGHICGYIVTLAGLRSSEIVSIAVSKKDRRRGTAQALLDWTLAKLRSIGVKKVWLMVEVSNDPAIRFYGRNQFERRRQVHDFYATGRHAWRMRLCL
jgi:ribosomal protein S18 acetylase RimI-like enzyme